MDNELEKLAKVIGSIVLTIFAVAIPIFCGVAYVLNMDTPIKILLTIVTLWEAIMVWIYIWVKMGG